MTGKRSFGKFSEVAGSLLVGLMVLAVPASMYAQTPAPAKPAPAKPAAAKPVVAAPAKPAVVQAKPVVSNPAAARAVLAAPGKPATVQTAPGAVMNTNAARTGTAAVATPVKSSMTPSVPVNSRTTNQIVQPAASRAVMTPANTRGTAVVPGVTTVGGQSAAGAVSNYGAGGQRGAVVMPGAGSFLWGDWTLVAYGCYRTGNGTRVLCDFDATKQNGSQANANAMWGGLNLVDQSGRVTIRHSAFFMGDDGSQFETGYVSTTPVRLLMEYDDVSPNVTGATLVQGQQRVQGIAITAVDPNAPPGSIPARGAAQAAPQDAQATATAAGSPVDKAQQGLNGVNNQINNVNDKKAKAKGLWDQLRTTMQTPKK